MNWGGGGALLGSLDKVLKSRRLMDWLKKINKTSGEELRLHLVLSGARGIFSHLFVLFFMRRAKRKRNKQSSSRHSLKAVLPSYLWRRYQKLKHTEPKCLPYYRLVY